MGRHALAVLQDIIVQVWLSILFLVLVAHIQISEGQFLVMYVRQDTRVLMFLILQKSVKTESIVSLGMLHARYSMKLCDDYVDLMY